MATSGVTFATLLFKDFLLQHGLCDYPRAQELASKFDRELRQCDIVETEDGTTFSKGEPAGNASRANGQLGF